MPRGGARVGAGRKRLERPLAVLRGHRDRPSAAASPGPAPGPPADPVPVPVPPGLAGSVRQVWAELAPFATAERTLTPATAIAFALLCQAIVLERRLSRSHEKGGSNHRGMLIRVETGLARFRLAPSGKPNPPEKPVDPFAEFDGAPQ